MLPHEGFRVGRCAATNRKGSLMEAEVSSPCNMLLLVWSVHVAVVVDSALAVVLSDCSRVQCVRKAKMGDDHVKGDITLSLYAI